MATIVKFVKEVKAKDAVLFTGLPGIGLVGKIVVDYLLKQVKAEKVAEIVSDSFPPSVHTRNGLIEMIKDELHYFSHGGKDFFILAGPVQPSLDMRMGGTEEHYEFARAIVQAIKGAGITRVCTLAGINVGEKRMFEEPRIVVAGTSKKIVDEWKELGAITDKPEGLISGAAGLLLGIGKAEGLEGACLMGETNAKLVYGDHGSAKKLLEMLIKRFGFKLDMSRIEKEAQEIEKAFKELEKQFQEPEEAPPSGLSYVR